MIACWFAALWAGWLAARMVSDVHGSRVLRRHRDLALPPLSHAGACWTILVLDCSGSMTAEDYPPNRFSAARQAAIEYVRTRARRSAEDHVAVVGFHGSAGIAIPWCSLGSASREVESAILNLRIGGSTSIGAGLAEAGALWEGRRPGFIARWLGRTPLPTPRVPRSALRRVILLSDGGHNSRSDPRPIAVRMREQGVVIECVGIGARDDVDEVLLRELSSTVDGRKRYRFIGDGDARELAEQYRALGGALTR